MTTRTTTGGVSDSTWRELTDNFGGGRCHPRGEKCPAGQVSPGQKHGPDPGAVRSQVILELERKLASERSSHGYGEVTVQPLEEAPTVCLVTLSFTVAHGLNQIWLSAQITV
ncbi:MAG: hypothetical protein V8R78_09995 [Evtepia gabavorous]